MDMKPLSVATIAGDAEVDHAIATLVLAFGTHPVARWMYDDPHLSAETAKGHQTLKKTHPHSLQKSEREE